MSGNDFLNKNVLRWRWKVDRDAAEVISSGSWFHVWGPETENARLLIVDSLTAGTVRRLVTASAKPVGQAGTQLCVGVHIINFLCVWLSVSPTVEVNPSTQVRSAGDTTTISCHASGRPQPRISWQLNERALHLSDEQQSHYLLSGKCSSAWLHSPYCICCQFAADFCCQSCLSVARQLQQRFVTCQNTSCWTEYAI